MYIEFRNSVNLYLLLSVFRYNNSFNNAISQKSDISCSITYDELWT